MIGLEGQTYRSSIAPSCGLPVSRGHSLLGSLGSSELVLE